MRVVSLFGCALKNIRLKPLSSLAKRLASSVNSRFLLALLLPALFPAGSPHAAEASLDNASISTLAAVDKTKPSVPANFRASIPGARKMNLAWEPATDDSGSVAYEIEKNGVLLEQAISGTNFVEIVTPDTNYRYRVRAIDATQNRSDFTSVLEVKSGSETYGPCFLLAEFYRGIDGSLLEALRLNAKFQRSPDAITYLSSFETPRAFGTNYGVRVSGFLVPPVTGEYVFFIAAGGNAALSLSNGENPLNLAPVATEPAGGAPRDWAGTDGRPGCPAACENRSAPIRLEAGRRYYAEALMVHGSGTDHLGITWKLKDEPDPARGSEPLAGGVVGTLGDGVGAIIEITQQPASVSATENDSVTFSVQASVTSQWVTEPCYQWFRNGTPIEGANSASYQTPFLKKADSGAKFSVVVAVPGLSVTSVEAILTITDDSKSPSITRVVGSDTFNTLTVNFSEPIAEGAGLAANYSIPGLTISNVVVLNSASARLQTSRQAENTRYTLTASNLKDTAIPPNTIAPPGSSRTFTSFAFTPGKMKFEAFLNIAGGFQDFLSSDKYTNNLPEIIRAVDGYESPTNFADNFGARLSGFIVPPKDGDYIFYISTADHGELFLSSDENPANKKLIAIEPEGNAPRGWTAADRRPGCPDACENRSGPQRLKGGTRYYTELLYKDSDGSDNAAVTWVLAGDSPPADGSAPIGGENAGWFFEPPEPVGDLKIDSIKIQGGNIVIEWKTGQLESASDPTGPWSIVTGATSPFTVPLTGTARFFRLRQ